MTEFQTAQLGKDAMLVLENEAYKTAMKQLRDAVIDQWKQCPVRDKEGQTLLLQLAKLTDKFEGLLVGIMETGKLAQHRIDVDQLRDESRARSLLRRVAG